MGKLNDHFIDKTSFERDDTTASSIRSLSIFATTLEAFTRYIQNATIVEVDSYDGRCTSWFIDNGAKFVFSLEKDKALCDIQNILMNMYHPNTTQYVVKNIDILDVVKEDLPDDITAISLVANLFLRTDYLSVIEKSAEFADIILVETPVNGIIPNSNGQIIEDQLIRSKFEELGYTIRDLDQPIYEQNRSLFVALRGDHGFDDETPIEEEPTEG